MKITDEAKLIAGGVALALLAAFVLTRKGVAGSVGAAVGGAAVDLVGGVVRGTAEATEQAANSDLNPLKPFGEWLGGTVYDWTH